MQINNSRWVGIEDFTEEAQEAYREFAQECGLHNGEHWNYQVGESGDDSTIESYIGKEKRELLDKELIDAGLKVGDFIDLVEAW